MDIHNPKPWRGWREFLKEYLIIVVGVLTALGAEQAVEWLRHETEVRDARATLADEILENVARLRLSIEENSCILPQLDAYEGWARGGPKPGAFRHLLPHLRTSTWETVKAGAVPHMPLKERVAIAYFYDQLGNQLSNRQMQLETHLAIVRYERAARLTPEQRTRLLETISVDRRLAHNNSGNALVLIDLATRIVDTNPTKEPPIPRIRSGVAWVCGRSDHDPFSSRS
jgi:hypothetical protein